MIPHNSRLQLDELINRIYRLNSQQLLLQYFDCKGMLKYKLLKSLAIVNCSNNRLFQLMKTLNIT